MQKYFINNNSDTLFLFFTGWGCDEYSFQHLSSNSDVLLLYNYTDLIFNFDFSKYKKINLISFSAGIFIASILDLNFHINKKIAIDGNPYLFDEKLGLSKTIQNLLYNITEDSADEFARNYLVKTEEEYNNYHPSKRTLQSCKEEFDNLKQIYKTHKNQIKNIYDSAIMGENDIIFNLDAQKNFYGNKLHIIKNARHNIFFRIKKYEDIFEYIN